MQQIKERGALPMIDRGDIRVRQSTVAVHSGFTAGRCYALPYKADSLIAKFKERAERSERLMYEQSHRDYSRLWLSASSSACHGLLIITVITPLPTKPSATKMPEN